MSQAPTIDEVMRKVAKLQEHSKSAHSVGNIGEAENYAAAVQRLLNQYRISMTDIDFDKYLQKEQVTEHWWDPRKHGMPLKRKRCKWVEDLARCVCKAYGCSFLVNTGHNSLTFVGREHTCKIVEYTLVVLVRSAEKIAQEEYNKFWTICDKNGERYKANGFVAAFLDGFNSRIAARLEEELKGPNSSSTAIVRVKQEWEEAKAHAHKIGKPAAGLTRYMGGNEEARKIGVEKANGLDLKGRAFNRDGGTTGHLA